MGGYALLCLPLQSPCKEFKEVIDLHIRLVIMTTSRTSYALTTLVHMDYDFIVTIVTNNIPYYYYYWNYCTGYLNLIVIFGFQL